MKKRIISLLLVLSMLLCVLPAASAAEATDPKFVSCYLSLNESIDINFKTNVAKLPAGYSVKFLVNGVEDNQFITKSKDGCAVYTYVGLDPTKLGTPVTVQIVNESGTVHEATRSVKQYCENMLGKDTTSGNLKKLIVDLLNYGAAFQTYKISEGDATVDTTLVNSDLGDYASLGTATMPAIETIKEKGDETDKAVKWVEASLILNDSVEIVYQVKNAEGSAYTAGDLKLKVADYGEYPFEKQSDGTFKAIFDKLNPAQMRDVVNAVVVANGEEVSSKLAYSIESYAHWAVNDAQQTNQNLEDLAIAMIKYGDSAAAYQGDPTGDPIVTPTETVLLEDDFNDYNLDGWTKSADATAEVWGQTKTVSYVKVDQTGGNEDGMAMLFSYASKPASISQSFDPYVGKVRIDFVYEIDRSRITAGQIYAGDVVIYNSSNQKLLSLRVLNDSKNFKVVDGGTNPARPSGGTTLVTESTCADWTKYKIRVDIDTSTNTYDLYIGEGDGPILSGRSLRYAAGNVAKIEAMMNNFDADSSGVLYIDNVKLTPVTE